MARLAVAAERVRDDLACAGTDRVEGEQGQPRRTRDLQPLSRTLRKGGFGDAPGLRRRARPAPRRWRRCCATPTSTACRWCRSAASSSVGGGGNCRTAAIVIDLRRLDSFLELNETTLQVPSRPACTATASRRCRARGYSMGHWPQSVALSTVGGWIATRAAGQFSTRYGSIEDMLLGLEGGAGRRSRHAEVKSTPAAPPDPDPRHLFLGAEGTAGIVTEATLKVFPLPESRRL
ncbi:MAG: FAD-binding oxidoreductase [Candidatus Binatia bacterium]